MQGRCLALLSESPLDLPNSQLLLRATRAKKKKKALPSCGLAGTSGNTMQLAVSALWAWAGALLLLLHD